MRTLDPLRTDRPRTTPTRTQPPGTSQPRSRHPWWWAAGGASVGLAAGVGAYLAIDPWLEGVGPPLEDLQGLVSNVVPVGGLLGTWLGVWLATRRRER